MIPICASRPGSGRPSSYKPEHADSLRLYFESAAKRIDALITAGQRENLPFPTVSVALALQCDIAFGLALGAWQVGRINFLPHRERAQDVLRRTWYLGMLVWAVGGMFLTVGMTWALSSMTDRKQLDLGDVAVVTRSLDAASQAHREAQALNQVEADQQRWLLTRQALHQHTLQWAHVLNQAEPGLWVSGVTQQGTQWGVQGEALTSARAHDLLIQLNRLDIWGIAPEMRHLELLHSAETTKLPVWQFRIEAELKADQR